VPVDGLLIQGSQHGITAGHTQSAECAEVATLLLELRISTLLDQGLVLLETLSLAMGEGGYLKIHINLSEELASKGACLVL
jgi:hypothetical protein